MGALRRLAVVLAGLTVLCASAKAADEIAIDAPAGPQPKAVMRQLIGALSTHCPVADPADPAALAKCREGLAGLSEFSALFRDRVDVGATRPETPFWKLATEPVERVGLIAEVLPSFMFDGTFRAERKRNEAWVVLRLSAVPRKPVLTGLPDAEALAATKELVLAIDPVENEVWYALYDAAPPPPAP